MDYFRAGSEAERKKQRVLLRKLIPIVIQARRPLVIHCRDAAHHEESSATQDCVSRQWPVYVHCFDGGLREFELLVKAFPCSRFGVSPIILARRRHPDLVTVVRNMDARRLLLESDAPYLTVASSGEALPTVVAEVGRKVAKIRNMTLAMVLYLSFEVSCMFYQPVTDPRD